MRIEKSIDYCKKEGLFEQLEKVYDQIPSGICSACTKCCDESVNVSSVELLNILHQYFMDENGAVVLPEQLMKKLIQFNILEWAKPMKCPFLNEDKRCSIYRARPLPCRIFGNRTREAYELNLERITKQNQLSSMSVFKNSGLRMPKKVIFREIGYCEDYQRTSTLDDEMVQMIYDQLINMDGKLYFAKLISEKDMNQHLVGYFVKHHVLNDSYKVLDEELLMALRLDCLKELNFKRSKE